MHFIRVGWGGGVLITVMFIYFRFRSAVDSVHQLTVSLFESRWVSLLLTRAPHFTTFYTVKQKASQEVLG
jgi:hypothetical protein